MPSILTRKTSSAHFWNMSLFDRLAQKFTIGSIVIMLESRISLHHLQLASYIRNDAF
jgi:hypothetical protein